MTSTRTHFVIAVGLIVLLGGPAMAADWATYRGDAQRSGATDESLAAPLSAAWVFMPTHGPVHAWSDPQPKPIEHHLELPRMRFDDAFHVAAAGGSVFFGSSSENTVVALDAATGAVRWRFYTDGPVRLAPTVWAGKVYVGSDDGRAYCLDARTGKVVWTFAAAPSGEMILGSGRMISVWPIRTGVVVDGGVAYFGAGVFPAEGVYLYAVDAKTGKLLWKNDTYGKGGNGTVTPQGYMLASKERLFVPSGRAMPAAFSRADGRFLFHPKLNWRRQGLFGGTYVLLAGDLLITAAEQIIGIREKDGKSAFEEGLRPNVPSTGQRRLVMDGPTLYVSTGKEVLAADRAGWCMARKAESLRREAASLVRQAKSNPDIKRLLESLTKQADSVRNAYQRLLAKTPEIEKWRTASTCNDSMVLTGSIVFAGGEGVVKGYDRKTGKEIWSAAVAGRARGLAVANGRLIVSTDTGSIHCFTPGSGGRGRKVAPSIDATPFPAGEATKVAAARAARIVRETGVKRGFGLILGGDGRLAMELAKRTELLIYLVDPDAARVAAARKALTAAGVHGGRVVVKRASLAAVPYADYFANLIVCTGGRGEAAASPSEVLRMLKPCGGVAVVDLASVGSGDWLTAFREQLARIDEKDTRIAVDAGVGVITRGMLTGAGSWTHQYGEAGNSACGDDQLVKGSLGILWYGDPGPGQMPSRHASNSSPLSIGGRMFVQGENVVMAYDAYNGLKLWERKIPGALRVGLKTGCSNLAANADSLFVAVGSDCLRLDAITGKTTKTYRTPAGKDGSRRTWYYLACVGGALYGSSGDRVFAVDLASGKVKWTYAAKSLTAATICVGDARVFFVDRTTTEAQQDKALKGVAPGKRVDERGKPVKPDVRLVVALDAATGKVDWTRPQDVSDCVKISKAGGELVTMYSKNVLLLCGQPWNGHFWKEFFAGDFSRRSLIALSGYDGKQLWSGRKGYRSRPLIVGDKIIAEPWSHDLQTGEETVRVNPLTGTKSAWQMSRPGHHCGNIAGAPNALFYRSGVTAYYDLEADYGTAHFGAQRSGCWINCIPANGLVLMPEASSGCVCPFALMCTTVFQPRQTNRVWGMYSAEGSITPAKRLAINFGAPGDRKDAAGKLWLAYPRPYEGRLVLSLKLGEQKVSGGRFYAGNADFMKVARTKTPWVYASGCENISKFTVPLTKGGEQLKRGRKEGVTVPGDGKAVMYTVRLHFNESEDVAAGQRVFDVRLQGKTVLKGFDIAAVAGGTNRAVVKEFKGIRITGGLTVEMTASKGKARLCGVEAIRE
jgi:outer membrane protein assembly factor BamB